MDSFVYKWTNLTLGKIYIGWHKGTEDDGYVCSSSSNIFWDDYNNLEYKWQRDIIYKGTMRECQILESKLLDKLDVTSTLVYNNKNNIMFNLDDEVRKKLKDSAKKRGQNPEYRKQQSDRMKLQWQNPKHREKIIQANTGKKHSDETKEKIREARKLQIISPESRLKTAQKLKGVPRSEEVKKSISESRKNAQTVTCPHCGAFGKYGGSMSRWHFDNCKRKYNV